MPVNNSTIEELKREYIANKKAIENESDRNKAAHIIGKCAALWMAGNVLYGVDLNRECNFQVWY